MNQRETNSYRVSLKNKILAISLTMMSTISIVGAYQMHLAAESGKVSVLEQFESIAGGLTDAIAVQFFERYGDVQSFAVNPVFLGKDAAAMTMALNRYAELYGIYDAILFVDTQGHFVASSTKSPAGKTLDTAALRAQIYSDAPWFHHVMKREFTEDPGTGFKGTYFEDAQVDLVSTAALGEHAYGTSFSALVTDSKNAVIGVLTARANLSWVEGELTNVYSMLKGRGLATSEIAVLNKAGLMIAELDPASNGGDVKVKRNFDELNKLNLAERKVSAAVELLAGRSGANFSLHARKQIVQAVGYSVFSSKKWIKSIGWGVMVRENPDKLLAGVSEMQRKFYWSVGVAWVAFFLIGTLIAQRISGVFVDVSDKLRDVAIATDETSSELARAAQSVAEATVEQAAAVQETVSSMSEISSMIGQTAQNVKECNDIATKVGGRTEDGGRIMQKMVSSMDLIQQANTQLQNMANIINEVSVKTMVINDIVFKTQLLSINASIEAARAGQHGKGFSVVAEEVGNLAQMSGSAAKEIQALIQDSQKQVGQIIETTQSRVRDGQIVSNEALATFTEIASGIQGISERIQGISQATKEQETGIKQISTAMNEMDITTQRNSAASSLTSELATKLNENGRRIGRVMMAIRTLVLGNERGVAEKNGRLDVIDSLVGDRTLSRSESGTSVGHQETAHHKSEHTGAFEDGGLSETVDRFSRRAAPKTTNSEGKSALRSSSVPAHLTADDESFNQAS